MDEPLFTILATDTLFHDSPDEGTPDCRCSRCGQVILAREIALRAWPEDRNVEYRFHGACVGAAGPDEPCCMACWEDDCPGDCLMREPEPEEPEDDDRPDLGPCCLCEQRGPQVRNILLCDFAAPVPGTGWGCVVCGLPFDGASTVLCDACLDRGERPRFIIQGFAASGLRAPYPLPEQQRPFRHDPARHPGEAFPDA